MSLVLEWLRQRSRLRLNNILREKKQRVRSINQRRQKGRKIASGPIPPRAPGVPRPGTYLDLPMHEEPGVPSFFYRQPEEQEPDFGLGFQRRATYAAPTGPQPGVAKPTVHRTSSIGLSSEPNPNIPKMISHGRRKSYALTDLKAISHGGSTVSSWDGKVRADTVRPSFYTAKPSGGKPPTSSRRDPVDFCQ